MTPQKPRMPMEALRDEPGRAAVLSSEAVFRGAIFDVRRDRFRFGDGELEREYLDHPGAVAILAVDAHDRVLLIKQYRHSTGTRFWEVPAGLRDIDGESALEVAQRELAEETDLLAEHWEELTEFYPSPGASSERVAVFRATGVRDSAEVFHRDGEEAQIEVRWVPFAEALAAVLAGGVRDGITVLALLMEHARRTANVNANEAVHSSEPSGDTSRGDVDG